MMVQSHDNDRFSILLCDFQLRQANGDASHTEAPPAHE